jgi:hypothetical protein
MAMREATATELESHLESFFRKRVRLLGGYTVKLAPTEAGVPDRLVIMPGGRMCLVELKTLTGSVSPIQTVWHRKVRRLGAKVHVLYGEAGVIDWLRLQVEAVDVGNRTYRPRRRA